jgi:hypothetical protein
MGRETTNVLTSVDIHIRRLGRERQQIFTSNCLIAKSLRPHLELCATYSTEYPNAIFNSEFGARTFRGSPVGLVHHDVLPHDVVEMTVVFDEKLEAREKHLPALQEDGQTVAKGLELPIVLNP